MQSPKQQCRWEAQNGNHSTQKLNVLKKNTDFFKYLIIEFQYYTCTDCKNSARCDIHKKNIHHMNDKFANFQCDVRFKRIK